MFIEISKEMTIGYLDKVDLDRLPEPLKEEFLNNVAVIKVEDGLLSFSLLCNTEFSLIDKVRKYLKSHLRREIRLDDLYMLSSGTYTSDDIEQIFDAQHGACYYTGEPLTKSPKNYAIDHIVPVVDGGSSWPANLALTTTDVNRRKYNYSKRRFLSLLEASFGKEWADKQRAVCKQVDKLRAKIDQSRRKSVSEMLLAVEKALQSEFPEEEIEYRLVDDSVTLWLNGIEIRFPRGFLRKKAKCFSNQYIEKLVKSFL